MGGGVSWRIMVFSVVSLFSLSHQQQPLDSSEQEALYSVLDSLNPTIPWRTLFPDDLCLSAPHGVVCDFPTQPTASPHIAQLSFGYVSDFTPNPPCSQNATLNSKIFTSFPYLRKLFFYNCFNQTPFTLSNTLSLPPLLEELVFINNPSLSLPLGGTFLKNLTSLRRLILTGNAFHGEVPSHIGDSLNLEELTLSRNNLSGEIPTSLGYLKNLKVLDLSGNHFSQCVPDSLGNLTQLLKLDLSFNGFGCRIPESLRALQSLLILDLSFNRFEKFGVPLFLGEIPTLREVYLSGNSLSGTIPEIWENLGSLEKLGFSEMGLVGKIPSSMGVYLKKITYLGLDNNELDGLVPDGLLEYASEINLENNNLSGKVEFFSKQKVKVAGNRGLCVDGGVVLLGQQQVKACSRNKSDVVAVSDAVVFSGAASSLLRFDSLLVVGVLFVFTGLLF